jgi:hypothetical protein
VRIWSKKGGSLDNKKGASLGNRAQQKKGARLGKFGAKLDNSRVRLALLAMIFHDGVILNCFFRMTCTFLFIGILFQKSLIMGNHLDLLFFFFHLLITGID